ncbi:MULTISPECIES: hypothetical protein [Roseobacteraceae]|uniref:Uncharacterized protein n=1 Tax=Pseudosulfitobacter pseudonitzschiae TaxID=1402135 RepID=A0A221K6R7_9RHOB|nr:MULTISPECIES: hypothetical protein [Roseobacteraceae]ASM74689.1 hypothetical protein SULPSESMR1_04995 [Pseudosulfitobacter pseudonitzschiae]
MSGIRRFTTDYVAVEDRIRLSLERSDGTVRILWLTRPLLNKLAARLIERVDAAVSTDRPLTSGVRQRFVQQAAEASLKPQEPVRPGGSTRQAGVAMLVTSIGLRDGQGVLTVEFKGGDQVLEAAPFTGEALRQWLGVLYKCYCHGGWGGDFWPGWITPDRSLADMARMN